MPEPAATLGTFASPAGELRVVFFGPRESGKTRLLRACLDQANPDDEAIPLEPLQAGEVYTHTIETILGSRRQTFRVIDCDGNAANELLATVKAGSLRQEARRLAQAIRTADALVVAADATADPDQLTDLFEQFFTALEEARSYGREVGGLPVLLTLTKCDALLLPEDTPTDWLKRIERQKARFKAAFEKITELSESEDVDLADDFLPFGTIDLSVHATALQVDQRPELFGYLDQTGHFGVSSLWQSLCAAAQQYRERFDSGRRRLRWTLSGVGGLLATLMLMLLTLLVTGGFGQRNELLERLQFYQAEEPLTSVRLSDRNFNRYRKELLAIRQHPLFAVLPEKHQEFVKQRLAEFEAYRDYRAEFLPPRLGPAEIRTREQLQQLRTQLNNELLPPGEYRKAWSETEAEQLRRKWELDLKLLSEAESQLHEWYRSLIRRGNQLLLTSRPPDYSWRGQLGGLLNEANTPPQQPTEELPKSPEVAVMRGRKLKFEAAFRFDRVEAASRDWQLTREKLLHLRDLCDVIGLTNGPGTPSAVLQLPEPAADGVGSKELAAARLGSLRVLFPQSAYPDENYPEWAARQFPDPTRQLLLTRLSSIRETGLRHVRRLLLQRLGAESPEAWRAIAQGMLQEESFLAWGQLLKLLNQWIDPRATSDPVRDATAFLQQSSYSVSLKAISLSLPDDLLRPTAVPAGLFVLRHTSAGQTREYSFTVKGEPSRDRPTTTYSFQTTGDEHRFTYLPGDSLEAELMIRSGQEEYKLLWTASRSKLYQLDVLQQPPRLEKVGPIKAPRLVSDVRLTPLPAEGWPTVPQLLPDLR